MMGKTKRVVQRDYYTGEVIEEYNSIDEAAYDNWLTRRNLERVISKCGGVMKIRKLRFEVKNESVGIHLDGDSGDGRRSD